MNDHGSIAGQQRIFTLRRRIMSRGKHRKPNRLAAKFGKSAAVGALALTAVGLVVHTEAGSTPAPVAAPSPSLVADDNPADVHELPAVAPVKVPVVQQKVHTVTPVAESVSESVDWDAVAQCESSGDWSINTGNGFSGGLQFTPSTWQAFGGGVYAPEAYLASRVEQMKVANRVLAGQGIGAWPVCGPKGEGG
jgi:hypothetical protein